MGKVTRWVTELARPRLSRWPASLALPAILTALIVVLAHAPEQILADRLPHLLFQSPLPEPTQPVRLSPSPGWIWSDSGGGTSFGPVVVRVPPGFTHLEGAVVMGNMILDSSTLPTPRNLIPGTLFGLLVITADGSHAFAAPFELRVTLDAGKVTLGTAPQLIVMMYDPTPDSWEALPSEFHAGSYQIVARTATLRPQSSDLRTIFGVVMHENTPAPGLPSPSPSHAAGPIVNRNANLRAGPGTHYAIVNRAVPGQALTLQGRNAGGTWYQLGSGEWIAAFLVDNVPDLPVGTPMPTPGQAAPTATITPTLVFTPTAAITQTLTPTATLASTATISPTHTATPTLTSTPMPTRVASVQTPAIPLSFGLLEIPANQVIDLDEGLLDSFTKADLWFDAKTIGGLWLVPLNGARMAVMGTQPIGYAECVGAELSSTRVSMDNISVGTNFCIVTNLERYAVLRMMRAVDEGDRSILIAYIVWQGEDEY